MFRVIKKLIIFASILFIFIPTIGVDAQKEKPIGQAIDEMSAVEKTEELTSIFKDLGESQRIYEKVKLYEEMVERYKQMDKSAPSLKEDDWQYIFETHNEVLISIDVTNHENSIQKNDIEHIDEKIEKAYKAFKEIESERMSNDSFLIIKGKLIMK